MGSATFTNAIGSWHFRPNGHLAITILSVADIDTLPLHHVKQLMEITGYVHPRQALLERPEELPICSLL